MDLEAVSTCLSVVKYISLAVGIFSLFGLLGAGSGKSRLWADCTHPVEARVVDHKVYGDTDTDYEYFFVKVEYEYDGMQYRGSLRFGPSLESEWDNVRKEYPIRSVRTIYIDPEMPGNISASQGSASRAYKKDEDGFFRIMLIALGLFVFFAATQHFFF